MLRRVALLALPVAGLALLGASIVFAQQTQPDSEALRTPPQATPEGIAGPSSRQPEPTATATPNARVPTPTPAPQNNPAQEQRNTNPNLLPPAGQGLSIMNSNIPPELMPVPEQRPLPSGPTIAAMNAATGSPDLMPIREAPPVPSLAGLNVPMNFDPANPPVPEAKPLPGAASVAPMTAATGDLVPIRELPPVAMGPR